jgi:photosystem II stability/assembly factor-like uncharacterized protein
LLILVFLAESHKRLARRDADFLRQFHMRQLLIVLLLTVSTCAQSTPKAQLSNTTEGLRGVTVVSDRVAWASGTHDTYLRTADAGAHWIAASVPSAETLDFRAVVAFSANEAFLMSAGPGIQSRIYHTADAGQHWSLQFTNSNPKGFFDSMAFWDSTHGIVLGDPVPDENGVLKFELLITDDGQTWRQLSPANLPPALVGEGAFAASNTCVAILAAQSADEAAPAPRHDPFKKAEPSTTIHIKSIHPADSSIWFATGGSAARVFHSADRGQTWQVTQTPITHGPDSAGIFSIAFRDSLHGVIAGGDYKHPDQDGPNLAFTRDGGKTWTVSRIHPQAYFSAVVYDHEATREYEDAVFTVNPNFIFDLRSPENPTRISPGKTAQESFNAASAFTGGGALFVGPKGTIISVAKKHTF